MSIDSKIIISMIKKLEEQRLLFAKGYIKTCKELDIEVEEEKILNDTDYELPFLVLPSNPDCLRK